MLGLGARTGYDVRRAVDLSARFFWTISPVQIYPELKRLETAGMVEGHDDPRGGRPRRAYQLTDRGHAALEDWLAADEELSYELRDLGMLKLFFADAAPDDIGVAVHLEAMAERSKRLADRFRREIEPAAEALRVANGQRFPLLTARLGREINEWLADRYARLADELYGQPELGTKPAAVRRHQPTRPGKSRMTVKSPGGP
jgi:DNA-binding PadR family transcriptional regulator